MTLVLTYLLLPWGAWLLGTGLRRLAVRRVLGALVVLFAGLLPFGDPANKHDAIAGLVLLVAVPLFLLVGLLRRPPPRAAKKPDRTVVTKATQPRPAPSESTRKLSAALAELGPYVPQEDAGKKFGPARKWDASLRGAPNLLLRYRDTKGDITDREIRPSGVRIGGTEDDPRPAVIQAYCLMRRGARMFRVDRVVTAADAETGELVDLTEWIARHVKRG